MQKITNKKIAKHLGVSRPFITQMISCTKRPNWKRAKQLGELTNTSPILWLEGSPDEIKFALKSYQPSDSEK